MAIGEEAGLLEGDGGTNASAFADDADAALGGAIVVGAAIEDHAAAAFRTFLFGEHREEIVRVRARKSSSVRDASRCSEIGKWIGSNRG